MALKWVTQEGSHPKQWGLCPWLCYFRLLALCLTITSSGGQCCENVLSVIIPWAYL